ncbi:hypothetical protein STENM327S_06768 [Streptomyces tendae]
MQHPVEDHAVQGVAGEGAGPGDDLLVLGVVRDGGALCLAHLVDPVLQLGDGDPLVADDGRRARMRVVAAGGEQGCRCGDRGGEEKRGATAAAVQGNLPFGDCATVHKVLR